jgi:phosphoserine phosphatase
LHDKALHRVLTVARKLSGSADLTQILSVIIDAMRDLLDADRATVFEYDADTDELFSTVAHGFTQEHDAEGSDGIRIPTAVGLAGDAARTRHIINVADAQNDPRFNKDVDRETKYVTHSLLTIPLLDHDGALVGVAQVLNKNNGSFDDDDEEIAVALAAQAAVAMRRGRLIEDQVMRHKLERELELAREIQQSSFPSILPSLSGYDVDAWSEPAEEAGGDAYDVIAFPAECAEAVVAEEHAGAERAIFLVADATGHGVGPAMSVTQVRSMLRMATRLEGDLDQIAHHMNQQLCHDLPTGRFITTWLGELRLQTHVLVSFSAGQAPLLRYIAADDRFITLAADTMPFGVSAEMEIVVENHYIMQPGDIFAVISDGIYEAAGAGGEQFGTARVEAIIREMRSDPVCDIVHAVREAVNVYTKHQPADDDRTGVIIRREA